MASLNTVLKRWADLKDQITPLKAELAPLEAEEKELRKQLVDFFTDKVEGSKNRLDLANGYYLKLNYKLKRTIDPAMYDANLKALEEQRIPVDMLFKLKPELVTSAYRLLNDEQRKLVDDILTISPESPVIELVAPKK